MPSSGILRRVALVGIDVSEVRYAYINRVSRFGALGKLAIPSNRGTLMMEALLSSETSVLPRATRRNIPEDAFSIVTAVKTSNLT
jgi:hypothetical protein